MPGLCVAPGSCRLGHPSPRAEPSGLCSQQLHLPAACSSLLCPGVVGSWDPNHGLVCPGCAGSMTPEWCHARQLPVKPCHCQCLILGSYSSG